ncbi:MAG: hypothetical protein ACRDNF_26380, partial [Streptosporangiaceae bacterium]
GTPRPRVARRGWTGVPQPCSPTCTEQLAAYLTGDPGRGGHWDKRWEQLIPGYRAQLAGLDQS